MKKMILELVNGKVLEGYKAGNFVVYRDTYYWHIAHKSGYRLPGCFTRRKDATRVCQAADKLADWNFDDPAWDLGKPLEADIHRRRIAYIEARARCISDRSVLRWDDQGGIK